MLITEHQLLSTVYSVDSTPTNPEDSELESLASECSTMSAVSESSGHASQEEEVNAPFSIYFFFFSLTFIILSPSLLLTISCRVSGRVPARRSSEGRRRSGRTGGSCTRASAARSSRGAATSPCSSGRSGSRSLN